MLVYRQLDDFGKKCFILLIAQIALDILDLIILIYFSMSSVY